MATNEQVYRSCTFCTESKNLPAPEESFKHLFWDCPTTSNLLGHVAEALLPEILLLPDYDKQRFWMTGLDTLHPAPQLVNIIRSVALYCIWEMHQKKCCLSWTTFKINFYFELFKVTDCLPRRNFVNQNIQYGIYRNWLEIRTRESIV